MPSFCSSLWVVPAPGAMLIWSEVKRVFFGKKMVLCSCFALVLFLERKNFKKKKRNSRSEVKCNQ